MYVSRVTLSCCGIIAGCAVSRPANGVPFFPVSHIADADPQNILELPLAVNICARILSLLIIFSVVTTTTTKRFI